MLTQDQLLKSGVVGAGGAGFPTHVKLSAKADTLVCNAAECEPLLHKDKEIIRHFPEQFVLGLELARQKTGAERVIIGLKRKYGELIDFLTRYLPETMEICPLDDVYPAGDEFILVYQTLGRVIPPGGIPVQVGAVVMNVETALNTANAARNIPVTDKFLTVTGTVKKPATIRVPLGAALTECVDAVGGSSIPNPVYLVGGPMMGYLEEDPANARVTKTTGGIILLPQDHPLIIEMRRPWKSTVRIAKSACDQCSHCTELCPRNLLGHPVEPHKAMRSLLFGADTLVYGTQFCSSCNLCSRCSCPEGLDPRSVMRNNREKWLESGKKIQEPIFRRNRADQQMENRATPIPRLIRRLGLAEYDVHADWDPQISDQLSAIPEVLISLRQHIGPPCVPVVQAGETVQTGDIIGVPAEKDGKLQLGAAVHASIDGKVIGVENGAIRIRRE
ncbi:MAG: SLBB domain-containing protein [Thermoguttaceae bacterium]|nr:SLBB domain-containing protein [Thermoguttaceae bacterium]